MSVRAVVLRTRLALAAVVISFVVAPAACVRSTAPAPIVVLIGIDGWRWDYERLYPAPNLAALAARGSRGDLIPSFPSKTFPNYYTIVTGLYPGRNGIVANNIKDVPTGRRFAISNRHEVEDPMWWGGEPIWLTIQRAGRPAAAMFWPGSEAPIDGERPRDWRPFDDTVKGEDRVDQVLQWLERPLADRPGLITLYFSDVDSAGHRDGPESAGVRAAVERVDGHLGRLVRGLDRLKLSDSVNLVVVSDHGMAATSADRVLVLDDFVAESDVDPVDLNPTLGLFPRAGQEEAVYQSLANASPHLVVYRRAETPERWHLREHPRIPPLVGVVDEGWQILRRQTVERRRTGLAAANLGEHGYDPQVPSMRGIFVAAGPAFKARQTIPAFENVHVYAILCRVLGIRPAPNDGDASVGAPLLK